LRYEIVAARLVTAQDDFARATKDLVSAVSRTGASRHLAWWTARASSAGAALTVHVAISDALRRRAGTASPVPTTGGKLRLAARAPCGDVLRER